MQTLVENWTEREGQVVAGRFPLLRRLSTNGPSAVFLTAHAAAAGQNAAIKLIEAESIDAASQLARWQAATRLSHPHLIRIFEAGQCRLDGADLLYAVMEYADDDLSQVLLHRPLSPEEMRDALVPAVEALEYLHANGFVHGGLHPSNLLAVGDQLKISSDCVRRQNETRARTLHASPYEPPESIRGEVALAGDVWALGALVVEALTQRPPVWDRTGRQDPSVPSGLPQPFLDIARHSLKRDPQRRWTLAEAAARMRPAPAPAVTQPAKAKRPRPTLRHLIPIAAPCLVLAAVLVGGILRDREGRSEPASVTEARVQQVQQNTHPSEAPPMAEPVRGEESASLPPAEAPPMTAPVTEAPPVAPAAPAAPPAAQPAPPVQAAPAAAGDVIERPLPDVPDKISNGIQGTVRVSVRVRVDASGSVTSTELDAAGPSRYFARLATEAAQRWKFSPPSAGGRPAASEWLVQFQFRREGARASVLRVRP